MHELKFKVGDRVRVIANEFESTCDHGLEIGGEYEIFRVQKESREGHHAASYQEYCVRSRPDSDGSWVTETEIELVK